MIRTGALLTACSLLALLGAIVVHDGQGASWLIATSVALCVAGASLLALAPRERYREQAERLDAIIDRLAGRT